MPPDTMNCHTLVELVTEYLEGALPDDERARLEGHLAGCEHCQRYLEQIRLTMRLTGMLTEDQIEPEAREALRDVYRSWQTG
jgi:anti-sigma factor RsiW